MTNKPEPTPEEMVRWAFEACPPDNSLESLLMDWDDTIDDELNFAMEKAGSGELYQPLTRRDHAHPLVELALAREPVRFLEALGADNLETVFDATGGLESPERSLTGRGAWFALKKTPAQLTRAAYLALNGGE